MSRPVRTADAGKEMARGLGLSEETIELCTTGSACHKALKEMVAKRKDSETYPKEKFIEDVAKRFAEVTRDLRRITGFGADVRTVTTCEIGGSRAEVVAAAAPTLRAIRGGEESREVSALLGGVIASASAAPLVTRARSPSKNK